MRHLLLIMLVASGLTACAGRDSYTPQFNGYIECKAVESNSDCYR